MAEIDLIPDAYRAEQWASVWWVRFAWIVAVLCLAAAVIYGALAYTVKDLQTELRNLQREMAITTMQREEITRLNTQRSDLERQWQLLSGLRGGTSALDMFIAIDQAMIGQDVWFQRWDFNRAGQIVDEAAKTIKTGYFIVVPQGEANKKKETWQINTHMTINGEAKDHAALSQFIQRLLGHHKIADVKVLHTSQRAYLDVQVIEFQLVVVVNSQLEEG